MRTEIRYARSGDVNIACQGGGNAPRSLVIVWVVLFNKTLSARADEVIE
jgi:hypothetical protein